MISVYVNVKETLVPVGYRRDFQSISNEVCWRPPFQQPAKGENGGGEFVLWCFDGLSAVQPLPGSACTIVRALRSIAPMVKYKYSGIIIIPAVCV